MSASAAARARTRVYLTIDTEFSIGGAFEAPAEREPIGAQNVLCDVQGRSEGLGFMLDAFAASDLRATFFVEALQTAWFGDEPMGALARRIAAAGHDVQLHLHPVWTWFDRADWRERLKTETPNDRMHGCSVEQLVERMQRGMAALQRWGIARPVALRTGNLMVDRNVYKAMAEVGLRVASNVARAVFEPAEEALRFNAGVHAIEGIIELPVLTYADLRLGGRTHRKVLTITGSSFAETRALLERAHRAGAPAVVLLTHCHEFVKGDMRGALAANRVNQRRLTALCRYLRDADDRYEVTTMDRVAGATTAATSDALLGVPVHAALWRIAQNKLNDLNVI
ncbi:MAG: polysaccharide deacetylase family protein [Proteobacteria bacterium]|nr:polysaccharide deacetylase family protein [Pseudomonadota bacterium]